MVYPNFSGFVVSPYTLLYCTRVQKRTYTSYKPNQISNSWTAWILRNLGYGLVGKRLEDSKEYRDSNGEKE